MFECLLGIDEAGLGPILGPLTVGHCAFALPRPLDAGALLKLDLWAELGIGREVPERKHRPVVCDSKRLYSAGRLKPLEEEVLGWAGLAELDAADFPAWRAGLCGLSRAKPETCPWYTSGPETFPLQADAGRARLRAQPVKRAMAERGYGLAGLGVATLLEHELNAAIARLNSKSRAEFEVIGRIIAHYWQRHRKLAVLCDRQGGRTSYARPLRNEFPEADVRTLHESGTVCSYELTVPHVDGAPTMFIAFVEKGEREHLPIALASMLAKYLRELMMHQFNGWWGDHDPALKPTAGYYQDGQRWLQDTAALRDALGIDDGTLIRSR